MSLEDITETSERRSKTLVVASAKSAVGRRGLKSLAARFVLLAALGCVSVCATALADDVPPADYEADTNLACDTQEQAERFVALFAGDVQATIVAVNAEKQSPNACALMDVIYLRGARVGMARHGDNAFEVVRTLVVGIETPAGILPVRPAVYFSLFAVKEYAV